MQSKIISSNLKMSISNEIVTYLYINKLICFTKKLMILLLIELIANKKPIGDGKPILVERLTLIENFKSILGTSLAVVMGSSTKQRYQYLSRSLICQNEIYNN